MYKEICAVFIILPSEEEVGQNGIRERTSKLIVHLEMNVVVVGHLAFSSAILPFFSLRLLGDWMGGCNSSKRPGQCISCF